MKQLRFLLAAIGIGLLIALMFLAWKSGVGYVYHYQGQVMIEGWEKYIDFPDVEDVDSAELKLIKATSLQPNNATYQNELGRIYHYRAVMAVDEDVRRSRLHTAELYFKAAAGLRPSWPVAWGNLLMMKVAKGELNSEFEQLLKVLVKTGPFELGVQEQLIFVAARYWKQLPKWYRNWFVEHITRFASDNARNQMLMYGHLDVVCEAIPESFTKKTIFCRK